MLIEIVMLLVAVAIAVLAGLALVAAHRRYARWTRVLEGTEDIEGIYITVLGSIYAIFLAFMVFVVWTRFDAATQDVEHESAVLVDLYRAVQILPEPHEDELEKDLRAYAASVVQEEWPQMVDGKPSEQTPKHINQLWDDLAWLTAPGSAWADNAITAHILDQTGELARIRQCRLLHARLGIPTLLWWVLIGGAVLVAGFSVVFGAESFAAHSLKSGMIIALITMMLFAIYALNHPFSGAVCVSPEPLSDTVHSFDECDVHFGDT
jgi:hypothetical protein